jgi:AcrR family transcriptional regulator
MIDTANRLFLENGYDATSVREIAERVGCTEAALYYHFNGGKRELFRAVAEYNIEELLNVLARDYEAKSLYDLVRQWVKALMRDDQGLVERIRWISAEFPQLGDEERTLFYDKQINMHARLAELVKRFVDDQAGADRIAQTLVCAFWGYIQLYRNLNLACVIDFTLEDLAQTLFEEIVDER